MSWRNAVSLREELHQRELARVAEEIASSVLGKLEWKQSQHISEVVLYIVSLERSEVHARVHVIVFPKCAGVVVVWGRRAAP